MTLQEISRISANKQGVPGKTYYQDNGDIWVGNSDGRIVKKYISDNTVSAQPDPTVPKEKLKDYLANLETFNDLTQDFLNSYKFAQKTGYKVFNYTGDNITSQTIYKDNTLVDLLYTVTYIYTGDNLTEVKIIKADGSFTLTKTLAYDINNNLTNITLT